MNRLIFLLTLAAMTFGASAASALSWQYDCAPCSGNGAAGAMTSLTTTFNDSTNVFNFDATFSATNGNLPNAGWLVVSPGPNPKGNVDEYAILYMDHANATVTAYVYNGQNSANSWVDVNGYLETYTNALTVTDPAAGQRNVSMTIDATTINSLSLGADWVGVKFGSKMGLWYHPATGGFSYDGKGRITGFKSGTAGWYDKADLATRPIPEPSAALAFGIGALLVGAANKRKSHRR